MRADVVATQHYSTAVEGNASVRRRYTIGGRFDSATYLGFVAERARWLAIDGWAVSPRPGEIEMVAAGPEALVGALEMACVLGPLDALVDVMAVSPEAAEVSPGFALRQK